MFVSVFNFLLFCVKASVVSLVVGSFAFVVVWIVIATRSTNALNKAFLATAVAGELQPRTTAVLNFIARASTQHALWLDLDMTGATSFDVDALVTVNGTAVAHAVRRVLRGESDGPEWYTGRGTGHVLINCSSYHGRLVRRVLLFTPSPNASIEVRVTLTPDDKTTYGPCRVLVTPTPSADWKQGSAPVPDLTPLAHALGELPQAEDLILPCDRFPCEVTARKDYHRIVGLYFDVRCPPLPWTQFRPAVGATKGLTGDPAFDRRVAVWTKVSRDVVLRALANAETRRAIVELTDQGGMVEFHSSGLSTAWEGALDPARVRRTLFLLECILRTLPRNVDGDHDASAFALPR